MRRCITGVSGSGILFKGPSPHPHLTAGGLPGPAGKTAPDGVVAVNTASNTEGGAAETSGWVMAIFKNLLTEG